MAEIGEKVSVDFIGRLNDGSQFSNSYLVGEPFEFVIGSRQMLPAFEKAVMDMAPGEEKTITIPAEEAYGSYDESLIERVPIDSVPQASQLPIGKYVVFSSLAGDIRVKVLKIEDDTVFFDHNHELAGEDLTFDIKLVRTIHELAVDREKHPAGCACGCDRVKEELRKDS